MIRQVKGSVKSDVYIETLKLLRSKFPETKFLIFRDNAAIHRSKMLEKWMQKSNAEKIIRFERIPPYCPDLNPNEYKGYIKKILCKNESDVMEETESFINFYQTQEGEPTKEGRRKARHFFKGEHTHFIYSDYVLAMNSVCKERRAKRKIANCDAA